MICRHEINIMIKTRFIRVNNNKKLCCCFPHSMRKQSKMGNSIRLKATESNQAPNKNRKLV